MHIYRHTETDTDTDAHREISNEGGREEDSRNATRTVPLLFSGVQSELGLSLLHEDL